MNTITKSIGPLTGHVENLVDLCATALSPVVSAICGFQNMGDQQGVALEEGGRKIYLSQRGGIF